jgi:ABC-2 type transport system ATP-binding protein
MSEFVLRARSLSKKFGPVEAVRNAAFTLSKNKVTAFLGKNGAGKTTTIKLILGFLRPDSGRVEMNALRVGYIPERPVFFSWLKGKEILAATARMNGIGRLNFSEKIMLLSDKICFDPGLLDRKVQAYSLGNQKKFAYLQNLLTCPELLVVDEPFTSLDPPSIKSARELFLELKREGGTVFLSSHLVSEVEKICDEFIIINRGNIIVQEDLNRIQNEYAFFRLPKPLRDRDKFRALSPWFREEDDAVVMLIDKRRLGFLPDCLRGSELGAPERPDLEKIFLFFIHKPY